jgi:predicted glutamine amidotransferase
MIGPAPGDSILVDQLLDGTYSLLALGESNPDGWGVAYYSPALLPPELERPQLLRGGLKANHEYHDGFTEAVTEMLALEAYCGLAHLRRATAGPTGIPNPHPLWREGVVFAHNGTVSSSSLVSLLEDDDPDYLETHPPHYTDPYLDTELFLLYVLKFREQGVQQGNGTRSHALPDAIGEATFRAYEAGAIQTAANCVALTGDTLIMVRFDIDDQSRYKARYLETPGAWIVASEPVGTDTTGWKVLPPKSMGIFTATDAPEIVTIFPPHGPYLVVDTTTVDDDMEGDSYGNGDGDCDAGEQIELIVLLRNDGYEAATNVRATITTADSLCQITDDYEEYPDIPSGEVASCLEDFDLIIAGDCPDGHQIVFTMTAEADSAEIWERQFSLDVHAPVLTLDNYIVNDHGNGHIEPGETFSLVTTLTNTGSEQSTNLQITLETAHPLVTILQGEATLDTLLAGGTGTSDPPFQVEVHDSLLVPDVILATLVVTGDWDFSARVEFMMPVGGFYDGMEEGSGNWTTCAVTPGYANQWHLSDQRNYTPGGTWSWKFGDYGSGDYVNMADGALESEPVTLLPYSYLRFRHWIDAEVSAANPGYCYDGGMVELCVADTVWEQIFPIGGYPYRIRVGGGPGPFPADTEVYSGVIEWEEALFEITGCEGEASFRFRFGSDGAVGAEGWYIDEVEFFGTDMQWQGIDDLIPLILHPAVEQSRPNPSGPGTTIHYRLPREGRVRLQIFDVTGRLIRALVDGRKPPGAHVATWDGRNSAGAAAQSGTYFYRFETDGLSETHP